MDKHDILLAVGFVTGSVLLFFGIMRLSSSYLGHSSNTPSAAEACQVTGETHFIVIENSIMAPSHVDAKRCDILTIANKDPKIREIAFGEHEQHIEYNGVTENEIDSSQSFSVVLSKLGTYHVHDHYDESVSATFTVKN